MGRMAFCTYALVLVGLVPVLVLSQKPAECTIQYKPHFLKFPECARYCLACEDDNYSFGHNCYYPSGQCCSEKIAGESIPYVWDCVNKRCDDKDAQSSVEMWINDCEDKGLPVPESLIPKIGGDSAKTSQTETDAAEASATSLHSSAVNPVKTATESDNKETSISTSDAATNLHSSTVNSAKTTTVSDNKESSTSLSDDANLSATNLHSSAVNPAETTAAGDDKETSTSTAGAHSTGPAEGISRELQIGLGVGIPSALGALATIWLCFRKEWDRFFRKKRRGPENVELAESPGLSGKLRT